MMGSPRALGVLVTLCLAGPALAQPPPPTDAQKQQAGDLVKKAIAKSQANDHDGAIKLYLEAYALIPLPILLSNVGFEYQQLQKSVDALKYFCMYLDKDPTGSNVSYVTAQAKVAQTQLGNKDGEVCAKKADPVVVPITTLGTVTPRPTGQVTGTTAIQTSLPDAGRGTRLVGIGVGSVGLATVGVGVFFGFKAKQNSDLISNHDKNMSWPDNIKQIEADGESFEKKQIIFTVAGGVLATTGAVIYFIGRSKRGSAERVTVAPTATPDTLGVTIGGGF